MSKWKIAKLCDVSWQTVHMWDKGIFNPKKEKMEIIQKELNKN